MRARARARTAALAAAALSLLLVACGTATDPAPEAHVFTGVNAVTTDVGGASRGGAIFFQNCASCHGADGHGGFAPDLVSSPVSRDFQQVYEQVLQGRGRMPSFADALTATQIRDVSAFVVDVLARPLPLEGAEAPLPGAATSPSQLQAPPGIDPRAGKIVYREQCAGCHAPDGSGGPLAGSLMKHPVAFADLVELIIDGNFQHGMPGYQRILGANQIEQVAAYVDEILLRDVTLGGTRSGGSATAPKG